jgi:hypothetical protein
MRGGGLLLLRVSTENVEAAGFCPAQERAAEALLVRMSPLS